MAMNSLKISQLEEIQELRNKHDLQMEELHKQHRNKLEDITHRFETIKLTLSEKVESLRGECDDLRHRARASEEALHRDADVKVQMALAPYLNLPNEIDSLKTVVEMRTQEISKLRSKNMDLYKQLEELPIAKEKICSLKQKVENLEAIITMKTDHEKQLHEKCQILMRKYDKESRANKRLSMNYEEAVWRMSQSSEFGSSESLTKRQVSRSPPRSETGSPDPRRRRLSPSSADVTMRVKRRNGEEERRLRTRSATFVLEKNESLAKNEISHDAARSPTASPRLKQKRWKTASTCEDNAPVSRLDVEPDVRMCSSDGPEMLSGHLNRQEDVVDACLTGHGGEEMVASYARSISGVSDSGMYSGNYDSLTRSEMLNSSIISSDSEWAAGSNVSVMLDSTNDDVDGLNGVNETESESRSSETEKTILNAVHESTSGELDAMQCGSESHTYSQFDIPMPVGSPRDNVFEDPECVSASLSVSVSGSASIGSSSVSLDGIGGDNSRLASLSEDLVCHDVTQVNGSDVTVNGSHVTGEMSRDSVSCDSVTGMARSETIVEQCVLESGPVLCNNSEQ